MKSETNPKTVMLKDYIIDMDSVSAKGLSRLHSPGAKR